MFKSATVRLFVLSIMSLVAFSGRSNAQAVSASGSAVTSTGLNSTVSLLAYVNGTSVVGNAKIQFATCYFTGYAEAISTPNVDSKGMSTAVVTVYGYIVQNVGGATTKVIGYVSVTQAPGTNGAVMSAFYNYNTSKTLVQNLVSPGSAFTTGVITNTPMSLKSGGVMITKPAS